MATKPLSPRQRAVLAKIGTYEWSGLASFNLDPKDPTLHALRHRGFVQMRHTRVLMEPENYDYWEVRLVITEPLTDNFKASVHNLIESMAPIVRKLLAKEIADVQYHMKKEKENVANG